MACLTFRRETNCVPPLRRSPGRSLRVCATLIAFVLSTDALSVASASPPEEAAAAGEIDDRLRTLVGDLGYEAEVGDLCCQFVADWNLSSWKQRIDAARRMEAEGRIKSAKVAGVQSQVLDELRGRLRATIQQADGMSEYFHLRSVFTSRKSQCVGNIQLLMVLGAAIGLDVRCLDVLYPPHGTLGERMYHSASIVRLADGRVRMVDERWGVNSPAFIFTDHYARHGIYWRLIDESNPLVLHRQVRPVNLQMVHGNMLVSLSNGYFKAERYDDAMDLCRRGLELDANSSYAQLALARLMSKRKEHREAAALVERALEIDPERSEAHAYSAALLMEAERFKEAVAAYDRAIALKPESPDALCDRGLTKRDLGDEGQAMTDLTACLRHDPRHTKALVARSDLWLRRKDLAAAKRDCDAAISIDPREPNAYWHRAEVLTLLGRPGEAGKDYETAVSLKQDDADLWFNVAMIRADQGKVRESLDAYTQSVTLSPRHVEALANRACVLLDLGRTAEALADCDRALAVDPRHAIALFNRGVSLAHLGRKTEAREAIEQSVQADPSSRPRATQAIARFKL